MHMLYICIYIRFQVAHLILSPPLSLSCLQSAPYTHISLTEPIQFHINFYYIYARYICIMLYIHILLYMYITTYY